MTPPVGLITANIRWVPIQRLFDERSCDWEKEALSLARASSSCNHYVAPINDRHRKRIFLMRVGSSIIWKQPKAGERSQFVNELRRPVLCKNRLRNLRKTG